jgi:uncharacterized protein YbjT (DUF2867 family)
MKIVVIGGNGRIGSKLIAKLIEHGHECPAKTPNSARPGSRAGSARSPPPADQHRDHPNP